MRPDSRGVSDALEFDPGLYRGTTGYYDRFRVPYPQAMLDELLAFVQPSGRGRLLDLACGTGQITFAIAERFAPVWAVDQEPDMIRVVREKTRGSEQAMCEGSSRRRRGWTHRRASLSWWQSETRFTACGATRSRRTLSVAAAERLDRASLSNTGPWNTREEPWERAMGSVLSRWLGGRS